VGFVNLGLAAKDPYKTHQQQVFRLSHKKLQNELTFYILIGNSAGFLLQQLPSPPLCKKKLKVDKYLVLAPHLAPFLVP
jgi:uncharacterized protein (DUF2461 family)